MSNCDFDEKRREFVVLCYQHDHLDSNELFSQESATFEVAWIPDVIHGVPWLTFGFVRHSAKIKAFAMSKAIPRVQLGVN